MTPERAVAIRCYGPFLYPFLPWYPPQTLPNFLPFRGISSQTTSQKSPGHPPKNSPHQGGFLRKKGDEIPWHCPQILPSGSPGVPSNRPQMHLQNNRNLLKNRLYFESIPLLFLQNLPRAIPLKGVLVGEMWEKMIGNVGCEAILSERGNAGEFVREDEWEFRSRSSPLKWWKNWGFVGESERGEMRGKVAKIEFFGF